MAKTARQRAADARARRAEQKTAAKTAVAAKAAAQPLKGSGRSFKVRAVRQGYYDHIRRREGDVFTIANEQAFSKVWMVRVSAHTPDKITTGPQELQAKHDEVLGEKLAAKGSTGDANVLGG